VVVDRAVDSYATLDEARREDVHIEGRSAQPVAVVVVAEPETERGG
jgi:hypothetical protein